MTAVVWALAVAAAAWLSPGCVIVNAGRYTEREYRTFAVDGTPRIWLSTFHGSIDIRSSDRREVSVTIEKRAHTRKAADAIDTRAEQIGDRIVVDVRFPRPRRFGFWFLLNGASARLIVTVPQRADVRAESGDGAIDIRGVSGTINLRSGDGAILGRDLAGDVKARTGDGAVRLDPVVGTVDVGSGDGNVVVAGRLDGLLAHSGDGAVTVRAATGSSPSADWDIHTGDGSIRLEVPEGFSGDLDAHTGDGSIQVQDLTLADMYRESRRKTIRGRLGEGGYAVRLRTGDGAITIARSEHSAPEGRSSFTAPER